VRAKRLDGKPEREHKGAVKEGRMRRATANARSWQRALRFNRFGSTERFFVTRALRQWLWLTVGALSGLSVAGDTLHVSLSSTNPIAPYATWETAATNIRRALETVRALCMKMETRL
jgi:hypothetical protein